MRTHEMSGIRWRRLAGICCVAAAICLTFAAVGLAVDEGASAPELSAADTASMTSLVTLWNQGNSPAWPGSTADVTLSKAASEKMNIDHRALAEQVGTDEFIKTEGAFDVAGYMSYQRQEAPDSACLAHEAKAVSIEPVRQNENGDIVAKVMVWQGWKTAEVDVKTGDVVATHLIDQTPVHVYVFRKTDGGWRIVKETRYYRESSDADLSQFGPDTPHKVLPPTDEVGLN